MNASRYRVLPILGALALVAASWCGVSLAGTAAEERYQELDTPFVTTPANVLTTMLDLAKVSRGDRLIDLGSGDGRIVIAAAKRGATALGVEIDPRLLQRSRENAQREGVADRASFRDQDLFETDFSAVDVVTIYLLPDVNRKLSPKLYATLHPGARIVSHDYDLGDWPPDQTVVLDVPDKPVGREKKSKVFSWVVPARIDGQWKAVTQGKRLRLDLKQSFQFLSGTAQWAGMQYVIDRQRVAGTDVTLQLTAPGRPAVTIALRTVGDHLEGTLQEGAGTPLDISVTRRIAASERRAAPRPAAATVPSPSSAGVPQAR